jgi:hypothetical protein
MSPGWTCRPAPNGQYRDCSSLCCPPEEIVVAAEPARPLDLDDLPLDIVELTAQGYTVESLTADSSPISACICPCSCACSGCSSSVLCSVS